MTSDDADKLSDYYRATDRIELAAMVAKDARRIDEGYRTQLERDLDAKNAAADVARCWADVLWWERQLREVRAFGVDETVSQRGYDNALRAHDEAVQRRDGVGR